MALDAPPAAATGDAETAADAGRDDLPPVGRRTGRRPNRRERRDRRDRRDRAASMLEAATVPVLVGVATLVLRLLTAAQGPTDWDSAQYAAAVGHFDVAHGEPQPPGYWLYVAGGRLLHAVAGLGVIHSLVVISALASAVATGLTVVAGRDLGGRGVGLAAGVLMITSPFLWFSGSVVATYSFDAVACALLIVLAWRAAPGTWHGVGAVATLGLLAGFRQSIVQSFLLLALIPVVAATRSWRRLIGTVAAGLGAAAVWFVPMALQQPGGVAAWWRATRIEATGAARSTSVLDHAPGGSTNLGTFAAYTIVALAPLAVLAALAALVLTGRRLAGTRTGGRHGLRPPPRRWYQRRSTILAAAIVPPAAIVALVQFAKGGYLLAYLPAAVIALLLPVAAVVRQARGGTTGPWMAAACLGVAAVAALGAQRFLAGAGVLPASWVARPGTTTGLWLSQPRYQAPYPDTRATIRQADRIDAGFDALRPLVRTGRDVVVLDTVDGGVTYFRNAGWSLPHVPLVLVGPGQVIYGQRSGALYYGTGAGAGAVVAGPSGRAVLVASPALPGLARLVGSGAARPLALPQPIGDYRAWLVRPGRDPGAAPAILGVPIVERPGPRPLGGAIR